MIDLIPCQISLRVCFSISRGWLDAMWFLVENCSQYYIRFYFGRYFVDLLFCVFRFHLLSLKRF